MINTEEPTQENLLDDFSGEKLRPQRRRNLLPWWIRIFVWLFMILGVLALPNYLIGLFGGPFEIELYGLETGDAGSIVGLGLGVLFLFKGVVAFSLWFEEKHAVTLAMLDAVVGILLCVWIMSAGIARGFRGEAILLIPYLVKMIQIRKKWEGLEKS